MFNNFPIAPNALLLLSNPAAPVVASGAMAKRGLPPEVREIFVKFGRKGGRPRHRTEIPAEKRKAIAKKAAQARWAEARKRESSKRR
jgi:hypothetical protein